MRVHSSNKQPPGDTPIRICLRWWNRSAVNRGKARLPGDLFRKELSEEIVIVRLQFLHIWFCMSLGVKIVLVKLVYPTEHFHVMVVHQVTIGPMLVCRIEGVIAQHVKRLLREVLLHRFIDTTIMPKGQMNLVESTVRLIDAVLGRVHGMMQVGVLREKLREHNVL